MSIGENGLELIRTVRRRIDTLRRRHDYLLAKLVEDGRDPEHSYDAAEAKALAWALPILEAEWDNLARLRRNVGAYENRLQAIERGGADEDDLRKARRRPRWDPPVEASR